MPKADQSLQQNVRRRLDALEAQWRAIEAQLEDPAVVVDHRKVRDLSIAKAAIDPLVVAYRRFQSLEQEARDLESAAASKSDADLAAMAAEELPRVLEEAGRMLDECLAGLVNSDDNRVGSVMMEIRAGAGGDEAALWARDLLEMYQKYAAKKGWSWETLEFTPESDAGGLRNAVVNIKGPGVWSELAFEAGVHSVKRVPATEAQGRIHTSTATVAVLPEPEEVDIKIDWVNDVEEHVTTSQGPGGQNVNKVATAVQLLHKPSGILIRMQESKSQQQNRERARRLLVARLYDIERKRQAAERSAARRSQIGTGERSEKIRTYRFKDGIVADERLPGQYNVREIIAGDMEQLFKDLIAEQTARRLADLDSETSAY